MYYYKFNIADWHLATSHLSLEEEAIYFKLINFYYDSEQPIPQETQTVIRRLRLGSYADTVQVILNEFFELCEDGWHHQRCDDEIHAYHLKAEKNQIVGKLGGRPKKNKDLGNNPNETQTVSENNPQETLTTNHKPLTINQEPNILGFDLFWLAYGKKKGKPNAIKEWLKLKLNGDEIAIQTIINKAKDQAIAIPDPKFRKDPERWLKGHHWEDEYLPKETKPAMNSNAVFARLAFNLGDDNVKKIA
jgi:uncharacterized protein YdaU (DUF1376 family)